MPDIFELRERLARWGQMFLQTTDPKAVEVMKSIISALETEIRGLETDQKNDDETSSTPDH
jgi:hypothetical protein